MKYNINKLNKQFESRVRLGVMSILMINETTDFNTLKENLEITDGNLASHLKALEKNDFISVHKEFINRKPKTSYKITPTGRDAFKAHIEALESFLKGQ